MFEFQKGGSNHISRVKNTKRNIISSYLLTVVTILFNFIIRICIVRVFGEKILGLSGLFTSVLTILTITEMGFSNALIFALYKPLATGDAVAVCSLLNYYKHLCYKVGTVILAAGVLLIPFIPRFIQGEIPETVNVYWVYCLYLTNTFLSYFLFIYKSILLDALQRIDVVRFVTSIVSIIRYALQVLAIVFFKNYYLFVFLLILGTVSTNVISALICSKKFPEYRAEGTISKEVKEDLFIRVKGLFISSVCSKTYSTFDNILISFFVGLSAVAIYNNYYTICFAVLSLFENIKSAMQASVGNSIVTENIKKNYDDMLLFQFLFSSLTLICVTIMFNTYQPFMVIWMGRNLLLPMNGVVLFCSWFVVSSTNFVYMLYLSGCGLWYKMKSSYIFSALFNIIMNISLGKVWGLNGIVLSSVLANLIFGLFWQCKIVFVSYFKTSYKCYVIRQLFYYFLMFVSCAVSYYFCGLIKHGVILNLFLRILLSLSVSLIVLFLGSFRTNVYKKSVSFMKVVLKRN